MKLDEILKESRGSVKDSLAALIQHISEQEDKDLESVASTLTEIAQGQRLLLKSEAETQRLLQAILDKEQKEVVIPPYPEFPKSFAVSNFPPHQKIDMPTLSTAGVEAMLAETNLLLQELVAKETPASNDEARPTDDAPKSSPRSPGGAVRRRNKWVRASTAEGNITSAGDGLSFYLPWSPIPNSETVRLNGAAPLSQGEDYTISANKITFVLDQSSSKIEVRAQT